MNYLPSRPAAPAEATAPRPTPAYVIDAMMIVAAFCEEREYVSVLIGDKGGAIFYRECPLVARQRLYTEIERLQNELTAPAPAEAATRTFPPHANAEPSYADLRAAGLKAREKPPAGMAAANREHCGVWAEWIERYEKAR